MKGATLRVGLTVACLSFATTSAFAGTVITKWDFELDNAWTAFTEEDAGASNPVTGSNPNAALLAGFSGPLVPIAPFAAAPSKLSWGEPNNEGGLNPDGKQSSLEVGSVNGNFDSTVPGTPIITNGAEVATVKVIHDNNQITLNTGELSTATLTDVLTLKPIEPVTDVAPAGPGPEDIPGQTFHAPALSFSVDFEETANSAPCGFTSTSVCDDIFVVDVTGAGFVVLPSGAVVFDQMFGYDPDGMGVEFYNARIRLDGLVELDNAICIIADASIVGTCLGLQTEENKATSFQAFLSIQHKPGVTMSEPSALAVIGLGLVGLGIIRRRRKIK